MIENDLKRMKKYKIQSNKTYDKLYDQQLGSLCVYIIIETTVALESPKKFVQKLKEMRNEKPFVPIDAYKQERVISGWQKTLDNLIKEFDQYV